MAQFECPYCGSVLTAEQRVCPSCGKTFGEDVKALPIKNSQKITKAVAIALIVISALVFIILLVSASEGGYFISQNSLFWILLFGSVFDFGFGIATLGYKIAKPLVPVKKSYYYLVPALVGFLWVMLTFTLPDDGESYGIFDLLSDLLNIGICAFGVLLFTGKICLLNKEGSIVFND